jgi:hypothetical protein
MRSRLASSGSSSSAKRSAADSEIEATAKTLTPKGRPREFDASRTPSMSTIPISRRGFRAIVLAPAHQDHVLRETGTVVDRIRRGTGTISEELGDEIDKLNLMVAVIASCGGLIVLLFG